MAIIPSPLRCHRQTRWPGIPIRPGIPILQALRSALLIGLVTFSGPAPADGQTVDAGPADPASDLDHEADQETARDEGHEAGQLADDDTGHRDGAFSDAFALYRAGDYAEALAALSPLAEAGDNRARFVLGQIYSQGLGVEADPERALELWQAAAQGPDADVYALYSLGVAHERGEGVEADPAQAADYYESAANRGLGLASLNLAVLTLEGRGVSQDAERAFALAVQAMLQGADQAAVLVERLSGRFATQPAITGDWQIADHWAAPDRRAATRFPETLAAAIGRRLRLAASRYQLGAGGCPRPSFTAAEQDLWALLLSSTGAADPLLAGWPGALPGRGDRATAVGVVCGGRVLGHVLPLPGGEVLAAYADGYLVGLPAPSPEVAAIQEALTQAGYDPGPADGLLGPRTMAAVAAFRADSGAPGDGLLDRRFREALAAAPRANRDDDPATE